MTDSTTDTILAPELLYTACDPAQFDFKTTEELPPLDVIIGQDRAVEATRFAIGMSGDGYNLFAFGPRGTGKSSLVRRFLERSAPDRPVPDDWAYVNNFTEPHKPVALRLPPGRVRGLADDMERLVEDLQAAIPAAFEGEDYRNRRQAIEDEYKETHEKNLEELQEEANKKGVAIIRTPTGLAVAPVRDGEVLKPDEFQQLPAEEQETRKHAMQEVQEKLQATLGQMPRWEKEHREQVRKLDREVTEFVVGHLISELKSRYQDLPAVFDYLEAVHQDVIRNAGNFVPDETEGQPGLAQLLQRRGGDALRRYQVNVMVDNSTEPQSDGEAPRGAPIVEEDYPIQPHLVGRIEHLSQMGALVTDFTMIKPGALHLANGGYLVLDARKLLMQPFAWEALKRALNTKRIRLEAPGESYGFASTVTLDPEPIPLEVKVILMGESELYYLLARHDPDFSELFKVVADFDTQMDRSPENARHYAQLIAAIGRREELKPLDVGAVARVVERGARMADDSEKLSTHMASIVDLVREADFWAADAGAETITAAHIDKAVSAQIYRSDRVRERLQEMIERDTIVIETEGARVGEVNGLAVYQLDHFAFGRPSRISCRVHLGKGEVIDIEREVDLGGPLHTKGVLILSSYLSSRFSKDAPLALAASLVFEQSYSGVDGDSASSAELYALLSAISEIPLKQSFAVTGSVDQHGRVQAIGGVNEKIEGFFDVCQARGLTGEQGVLIPAANVKHLMLRSDVVEAVKEGKFAIHAVKTIDQGLEILTGMAAGEPDDDGEYPFGSVNRAVATRLAKTTKKVLAMTRRSENGGGRERGER